MNKSGLVATVTVVIFVIAVIWVQAVPLQQNGLFNDLTARRIFAQFLQVRTQQGQGILDADSINATTPQGQGKLNANFINADVVNVTTGTGTLTSNKISAGTVDATLMNVITPQGTGTLTSNKISVGTIGANDVQARAFELLDQQNKVRASLKVTADNQPELVLLDKNGQPRIRLTIDKDNNAVVRLLDQNGQPRSINP